jgi:hypothetical protein
MKTRQLPPGSIPVARSLQINAKERFLDNFGTTFSLPNLPMLRLAAPTKGSRLILP